MEKPKITRREFFREGLKGVGEGVKDILAAVYTEEEFPKAEEYNQGFIRPPGALDEKEFLERCTRCNECVKVCPEESVMKFVGEGSAHHLTPILNLRKSACILCEGFPCVKVCEPEALTLPSSPREVKMGIAAINSKLCHAWQGMDCDYCVKECPLKGEAILMDEKRRPYVVNTVCTGCGLCEHICPSRQSAIVVEKKE